MARLVVYVPLRGPHDDQHLEACLTWCAEHREQVAGVTRDPATARRMVIAGEADAVLVAVAAHERGLPGVSVVRLPG
jgi:hypothetical protein